MNGVDFAIIGVFIISCLMGIARGFTREILGLLTWGTSATSTYLFIPVFSPLARGYIANPMIADSLTGLCLFITSLVVFSIITNLIAAYVRSSTLGGVDRSLGLGFGTLRAVLLFCVCEIIFSAFTARPAQPPSLQNARFVPLIRQGGDVLLTMIPRNWQESLKNMAAKTNDGKKTASVLTQHAQDHIHQQAESLLKPSKDKEAEDHRAQGELLPTPGETVSAFGTILPHSHKDVPPPSSKTITPAPQDLQKTAESLANLTPHAVESSKDDYDSRQRRDMDRLFQTNQR